MTLEQHRYHRRLETIAVLIVFVSLLVPASTALRQQTIWNTFFSVSMWTPPVTWNMGNTLIDRLHWLRGNGGTLVVLGLAAIAIFNRRSRRLIITLLTAYILLAVVEYVAYSRWQESIGASSPFGDGWLFYFDCLSWLSGAAVPLAMYWFLGYRPTFGATTKEANEERPQPDDERRALRLARYALAAAAITALVYYARTSILANLVGPGATWSSMGVGVERLVGGLLGYAWPVLILGYAIKGGFERLTIVRNRLRMFLRFELLRWIVMSSLAWTTNLWVIYTPYNPWGNNSIEYIIWEQAEIVAPTALVLLVLAFLPNAPATNANPECANCGYPLKGLQSDRCPECGTPHNLPPESLVMV